MQPIPTGTPQVGRGTEDICLLVSSIFNLLHQSLDTYRTHAKRLQQRCGLQKLQAGVNLNRSRAYRQMLQRGFRSNAYGIAMHKPDSPAFNRPHVFVMDDWH